MRQTKEVQPIHAKVWMTEKKRFPFSLPFPSFPFFICKVREAAWESYALSLGWNYSQCEYMENVSFSMKEICVSDEERQKLCG